MSRRNYIMNSRMQLFMFFYINIYCPIHEKTISLRQKFPYLNELNHYLHNHKISYLKPMSFHVYKIIQSLTLSNKFNQLTYMLSTLS